MVFMGDFVFICGVYLEMVFNLINILWFVLVDWEEIIIDVRVY